MGNFSQFPLQKAIYQILSTDTALLAMVSGIYDRPPQNTAYPYVVLGDATTSDWSSKTTTGTEEIITLHVYSREGGRKEASTIMERVHTLLHNADPSVDGHTLVLLRFLDGSITLESDGWTYNGTMRFNAMLEENS